MNTINIKDKTFAVSIPFSEIEEVIKGIAEKINEDYAGKSPMILGVLNGVFMFAAELMKNLTIPCEISFIKMSSYVGTQSTASVKELIGIPEGLKDREIIIIEDIIDTGNTMRFLINKLQDLGVKHYKIATFLYKPDAFKGDFPIDYIGKSIPPEFIVGFGFDYDGFGRNSRDIYTLVK